MTEITTTEQLVHSEAGNNPMCEEAIESATSTTMNDVIQMAERDGGEVNPQPAIAQPSDVLSALASDGEEGAVLQCKADTEGFVYAVGVLKPVFPDKGLQQTFDSAARVVGVSEYDYFDVFNYTDPTTKKRPYLFIAEQIHWVLSINQKDCYQLLPRSTSELIAFINSLKPLTDTLQEVYSTAIGIKPAHASGGSGLETIVCNHLFSQTLDELHNKLKQQTGVTTSAIQDVLKQLEFSPNDGRSDFSRAKNYLAFRYPDIYLTTHSMTSGNSTSSPIASFFLDKITANYSDLQSPHKVVDIVLVYKSKTSKEEKYYYCSVDVTNQFPFINSPLQPFMPLTRIAS